MVGIDAAIIRGQEGGDAAHNLVRVSLNSAVTVLSLQGRQREGLTNLDDYVRTAETAQLANYIAVARANDASRHNRHAGARGQVAGTGLAID
jgi:hypothetical protein